MEELVTLFTVLGGVASSVLSIVTCVTLFAKPVRSKFIHWIKDIALDETREQVDQLLIHLNEQIEALMEQIGEQTEANVLQTEALKSLLRNTITHIYYKNEGNKTLRDYEAKTLTAHYEIYTNLKGNGFIKQLYKIMTSWEIVA